MEAIYVSANSFKVTGSKVQEFSPKRRVKLDCGVDGFHFATIVSSSFSDPYTTVIINEDVLTTNLIYVFYGVVNSGEFGNMPDHLHSATEGDGGSIEIISSFAELIDTPTTYSGTDGMHAQSTGSGIVWGTFTKIRSEELAPVLVTQGAIGDLHIDETNDVIYKKYREANSIGFLAKSIILDFADTWGTQYMGMRSIDFYKLGVLVAVIASDVTAYSTTVSQEPAIMLFDTALPKIDSHSNGWFTAMGGATNQRVIGVFNSPIIFDQVVVSNYHSSASFTTRGVKNTKIYLSSDEITSTVYDEAISNSTLLFDGVIDEHINTNTVDEQEITLPEFESDPGWDVILETPKNFTELLDTPSTYSGTEGMLIQSTGSGIVFSEEGSTWYDGESSPTVNTPGVVEDYYLDSTYSIFYKKNRETNYGAKHLAKSVIFDIADNWGSSSYTGFTSAYFYDGVTIISLLSTSLFDTYATTSHGSALLHDAFATDAVGWWTCNGGYVSNQRVIVVFNTPIAFNRLEFTSQGSDRQPKNVKIYTSIDEVTDTVYGNAISNSVLIFDDEMPKVDTTQDLAITVPVADPGWDVILETKNNFIELEDTPATYSAGQYLRTTASGLEAIDGVILKAQDDGEWLIQVTNSGTLYTTSV